MELFWKFDSYRRQNLVLGCTVLLLIFIIFKWNVSRTVQLYRRNLALQEKLALAAQAPDEILVLQNDLEFLKNAALKPYNRGHLLAILSGFCRENGLLIRSFPEEALVKMGEYAVVTNNIEVEGDFYAMLNLAYLLEREEKIGNINSLSFYSVEDRYEKTTRLHGRLIIRNVIHSTLNL